jgi:hypothetical protein
VSEYPARVIQTGANPCRSRWCKSIGTLCFQRKINRNSSMSRIRPSEIYALIAVHCVLAAAPVGAALLLGDFNDVRMLPFIWALSSIPFSQIMLLSIWVGMAAGRILPKIFLAILATAWLVVWVSSSQVLGSTEPPPSLVSDVFLNLAIMLGFVIVLSVAMTGTSRLVGTIRFTGDTDLPANVPGLHYSLFALLAVSTTTALVLGLVRMSRVEGATDQSQTVYYLLAVVVFALNMLTTIWATLGKGHVKRRLLAVFLVSICLGFSMSVGAGQSPFSEPWWLFYSGTLIVVVPTAVVACSLLWLRRIGFRLVAARAEHESESEGCLQL